MFREVLENNLEALSSFMENFKKAQTLDKIYKTLRNI